MAAKTQCVPVQDLCIPKGATWTKDFIWQSNGVAVDLTGYTARMQIIDPADNSVIADLTVGAGLTITAGEGRVTSTLTHAETRAITQAEGIYDLILKSPGGVRTRRVKGEVEFDPAVSADVDA